MGLSILLGIEAHLAIATLRIDRLAHDLKVFNHIHKSQISHDRGYELSKFFLFWITGRSEVLEGGAENDAEAEENLGTTKSAEH